MAIELRQITSAGTYGEILPDWSDLTFSQDLLEPGTLTFDYPIDGSNASLLVHGAILAVLIDGYEPINGRFIYDEGKGSRVGSSEDPISTYGCTGVLGLGARMSFSPAVGSTFADENLFAFTDKTPGFLVKEVLLNTFSRANVLSSMPNWLTYPITTFTDTHDSSAVPVAWPTTVDVTFQSGDTLTDVLTWLTSNGFAEPLMDKRALKLFIPSNNGTDLSTGNSPTVLATGRDFEEATYQTTSKELINSLLVLGDDNSCAWVQDAASAAQYGYREGKMQVSNASQQATLIAAGQAYLALHKIPRWSYTYSVPALYLDEANVESARPFVDFRVGDSVLIMDGLSTSVQRIRLMSATWPSSRSATVNLSVNDLFGERDVELERRLARLGI